MENIGECTKTKSILNALGPIAEKIVELKTTRAGAVCDAEVILHLIKQCESFELACEHLKDCLILEAKRLMDKLWLLEIEKLYQHLISSIKNLADSTRDLHRGDVAVKDNKEVWRKLIFHSEILLESLLKLLLSWDRAQLQRIHAELDAFFASLNALKDAPFDYIKKFQKLVDQATEMFALIDERCGDISKKQQRETLFISSLQMCRLLRVLAPLIAESIRNRLCRDTRINRDLVLSKMEDLVGTLKAEINLGSTQYDLQESGKYINTLNLLFDLVSVPRGVRAIERLPLLDAMKAPLENILQHCICVSQCRFSSQTRSSIITSCEDVLHQMKVLSRIESTEYPNPSDVDVVFDVIVDVLEILEVEVNSTLVKLIVQAFTEPFLTLEYLLRETKDVNTSMRFGIERKRDTTRLESLVASFEDEVDRFYQIGGFVIACINDTDKVRQIESSLAMLSWLESNLLASILKISRTSSGEQQSLSQIHFLSEEWMAEVAILRHLIYSLMEVDALLYVTKQEIHELCVQVRAKCNSVAYESSDSGWFRARTNKVIGLIHRLLTTNQQSLFLVDQYAKELENALSEMTKFERKLNEDDFPKELAQSLCKRLQCLLTCVSRISSALTKTSSSRLSDLGQDSGKIDDDTITQSKIGANEVPLFLSIITDVPLDISAAHSDTSLNWRQETSENRRLEIKMSENRSQKVELEQRSVHRVSFQSVFKDKSMHLVRPKSNGRLSSRKAEFENSEIVGTADQEESGPRNISIDVTKFLLSRSSNTFRNSARASNRNFSLKVKEINLDIGEVVKITPKVNAPRYISPLCNYLDENNFDSFTEIIKKMEKSTNTFSTRSAALPESEGWATFAVTQETNRFPRQDLFYHTFDSLLPANTKENKSTQELDNRIRENQTTKEPDNKTKVNPLQSNENIKQNSISNTQIKGSGVIKHPGAALNVVSGKENVARVNHFQMTEINVSDSLLSSRDRRSSYEMDTPSSINISTPQRIDDIKAIRSRLKIMKF